MSRLEFKLPDIGEGVTEGEVVSWLVGVGDTVNENQDLVEVMTDKATVTIGSPKGGKILEIVGKEGDVVPVGSVLVVLDTGVGAEAEAPEASEEKRGKPKSSEQAPARSSERAATTASAVGDLKETLPGTGSGAQSTGEGGYFNDKPLAAPATRKLARELGIDLRRVKPSGPGGRITREDLESAGSAAAQSEAAPTNGGDRADAPAPAARPKTPLQAPAEGERRVPIRGLRKRIFENMARAKHTAAHFTSVDECESTELVRVRERAKAHAAAEGVKLTYLPFIVKAVVGGLRRHPALNCLVDDEKNEMVLRGDFNLGIAVATEAGLTVPVLRGADRLSMIEIQREIERLSDEARAGKTRREDLGGSSFTITSLGKQGGLFATPVVNYPEVAILGVHEMKRRPVVKDDAIVIGRIMLLSLSFDHRIIDGHVGAAFARTVIDYLESPERLLVELA
jgi:pyruvate dehydrogenase E2 component (dihydrolipoamide acetyltransferase)